MATLVVIATRSAVALVPAWAMATMQIGLAVAGLAVSAVVTMGSMVLDGVGVATVVCAAQAAVAMVAGVAAAKANAVAVAGLLSSVEKAVGTCL